MGSNTSGQLVGLVPQQVAREQSLILEVHALPSMSQFNRVRHPHQPQAIVREGRVAQFRERGRYLCNTRFLKAFRAVCTSWASLQTAGEGVDVSTR